ncbi:MAG: hypothetical protein BBJ57_02285 [Desulfobacterales bacterium PC51MH44]|nr:MAG: hypothetical protein BBJ57_02285 [Desulfobacterales bacterium PC51MH44]
MNELQNHEIQDIKQMIGHVGLAEMVSVIETICYEKAEHAHSSQHDNDSAELWETAGTALCNAYNRITSMGL